MVQEKYEEMVSLQQSLLACDDAAKTFQRESDELTFYVNEYLEEQSTDSLEKYYTIIDAKLREQEIQRAEGYEVDCTMLREALAESNRLAQLEMHAFALAAAASGVSQDIPAQVQQYVLSDEEMQFSSQEKLALAHQLIHGNIYRTSKKAIYAALGTFEQHILVESQQKLSKEIEQVSLYLKYQSWFEALENVLVILLAIVLYRKVTLVVDKYIQSVSENKPMEEKGTKELKYLAKVFNAYIEMRNKEQNDLRQKAEKDPLTQVANRRTLEEFMRQKLQEPDMCGAFLFLDVDELKKINDTYGHDVGDALLKCLVKEMHQSFRENDFISRFGGDEFVLWLNGVTLQNAGFIKERIGALNGKSMKIAGEEISLFLSAGVTFCKTGDSYEDVVHRADLALYEKKRNGKRGCMIYEEIASHTTA